MKVFLDDGEVPFDNNATEGALRSFCLHKHAWKLIDSIDGAKSSAIIYSITESKQEIIRTYSKSPIFAKLCLNES